MFDGLKDKLSTFKEDVEEEAAVEEREGHNPSESRAEPGDPEDLDEEAAADADAATAEAESAAEREASAGGEPAEPTDADAADTRPPAEEVPGEEAPGGDGADEGENGERGLLGRAKLAATGKTVIEEEDLEKPLEELELALLSSDVEMNVAQEILKGIRSNLIGETRAQVKSTGHVVEDALRDALVDVISVGQFDFEQRIAGADKPVTLVFTGVNGVGKTTTIAKLSQYLAERGYSSVLANGDTYRAGANEQIQQHADALDRKLISHEKGSDPAAVIYDAVEYAEANDVDVVLGDTAGRLHTSNDLMDQLEKIDRVIEPDMTLFVEEATNGQDAVNRAREFNEAAEIDGAVLTKADADENGGAAISIAYVTGKPILFLGTGQDYEDLEPFDPEVIADRLLGIEREPVTQ